MGWSCLIEIICSSRNYFFLTIFYLDSRKYIIYSHGMVLDQWTTSVTDLFYCILITFCLIIYGLKYIKNANGFYNSIVLWYYFSKIIVLAPPPRPQQILFLMIYLSLHLIHIIVIFKDGFGPKNKKCRSIYY